MGLPGDLTTTVLTGTFLDPAGNPMRGTVTIQPNATLLDATGNVIVSQIPRAYQLFNGSFGSAPCSSPPTTRTGKGQERGRGHGDARRRGRLR